MTHPQRDEHNRTHQHSPTNYGRAFGIGVALNLGFVLLELFYGSASHSLALIGDAAHNFSDVFALLLAWGASILVRRRATQHFTYGFRRTSILAALINAVILLLVTGGIILEALQRISQPEAVSGLTVMAIAVVGIVINTATALLFMSGRKDDLNIRGAFTHMAADALVALGVVIAGGAILLTGWTWLDPVISLVIAAVLLAGTWGLLRESVNLSLDAVPEGINTPKVQEYLLHLPGVLSIHDLHIWGMSTTETALTVHLVTHEKCSDAFLSQAAQQLHNSFGIEHTTLQVESGDSVHPCLSCPPLN
ncbi:MAG: cation diffusion facilitator family transporter [Aggregatilineales bacterium]